MIFSKGGEERRGEERRAPPCQNWKLGGIISKSKA
jgi:hypothetical protein